MRKISFLVGIMSFFAVQISYGKKNKCKLKIDSNFNGSLVYLKFKYEEKNIEWILNEKGETISTEFNFKVKTIKQRYYALFDKKGIYFLQFELEKDEFYQVRNYKRGERDIKGMFDIILKNLKYLEYRCEVRNLAMEACQKKREKYLKEKERKKKAREKFLKSLPKTKILIDRAFKRKKNSRQ